MDAPYRHTFVGRIQELAGNCRPPSTLHRWPGFAGAGCREPASGRRRCATSCLSTPTATAAAFSSGTVTRRASYHSRTVPFVEILQEYVRGLSRASAGS